MPRTAVGLFEDAQVVSEVVQAIEDIGFPQRNVQTLEEPASFEVTGVMSFPRLDFEVHLTRELRRIGTTEAQAQEYIDALRRGGSLVFATGEDLKVDQAAELMRRHGATGVEKGEGAAPVMPGDLAGITLNPPSNAGDGEVISGRSTTPGGGPYDVRLVVDREFVTRTVRYGSIY